jgi:hypothetical protein
MGRICGDCSLKMWIAKISVVLSTPAELVKNERGEVVGVIAEHGKNC